MRRGGGHQGRGRLALLLAGVLAIVVTVALAGAVLATARGALRGQAEDRLANTAAAAAALVREQNLRLGEIVQLAGAEMEDVPVRRGGRLAAADRSRVDAALRRIRRIDGVTLSFLNSPQGDATRSLPPSPELYGRNFAFRDWYRGVTRVRSPYVSRAFRSAVRGRPTLFITAVRLRSGAILTAGVSRRIQRLADGFDAGQGVRLTVLDQSGSVVARARDPRARLVSRRGDPLVAAALGGRAASSAQGDLVRASAPVPVDGWVVLAEVPASVAFDDVRGVALATLGLAALALLALLLLALLARAAIRRITAERASADLQRALLPEIDVAGAAARVHGLLRPGEDLLLVGGDFYDAVVTGDGTLAVVIGDVTGHGPKAAGQAAALRAGWRTLKLDGRTGAELADGLNGLLLSSPAAVQATALCVRLVPGERRVHVTSMGHPAPLLVDADGVRAIDEPHGPLIGGFAEASFCEVAVPLPDGPWSLLLYTDGLVEAPLDGGERLGEAGLVALVRERCAGRPVDAGDLEQIIASVERRAGGRLPDDAALVVVAGAPERNPAPAAVSL